VADPGIVFDQRVASDYDAESPQMFDPAVLGPTVDFLAEQARGGVALELGVGTGRVALPLSARGVPVHGIDESEPMVARLRAKPGADAVGVTIGDFATTTVAAEHFDLAYLVFNTITNLTSQEAQVSCFRTVAGQLRPGGRFVVEAFLPALRLLPPGVDHNVFRHEPGRLASTTTTW
jgi:SAM-dependent methyltransferase